MMNALNRSASAFRRDENGSMAIELLIVTPILVWVLLATFVYFDVFRVEATSNKAAITISEMFSREEVAVTDSYIDSALSLLETLTYEEENPDLRVTVYHLDEGPDPDDASDDVYRVTWSESRGFADVLTDADLADFEDAGRLPLLNGSDDAILVETRVEYDAPFSIGFGDFEGLDLEDVTFDTFIIIRPRPGNLCFDDDPEDDDEGLMCSPGAAVPTT